MGRLSFDAVNALIYDPVSANRTATRAVLYSLGFRHTETVSTLDAFVESMKLRPPDIALCEAQGAAEELCGIIQELRQNGSGYNPFIVIMVTAWEKNNALVNRVISSGADDLILRPFSIAMVGAKIETHIERRKDFVITSDYVGPDRRNDASRPSNAELFNPPNSLKMKAKEKLSAEAISKRLDTELRAAREKLVTEKLRRDAFQVCILWRLMQDEIPGKAPPPDLEKLCALSASIDARCRESEIGEALEWCEALLAAAEGLTMGVDYNATMHLLGHAALSLHKVFYPEKSSAEQLAEIDATMAIIRARNQTTAIAV